MKHLTRFLAAIGVLATILAAPARAEVGTVHVAQQFGISYLPLTLMQDGHLWEKRAKAEGIDLKVEWLRFSDGSGMNAALLSGSLELASGGVGPMITMWGKTRTNLKVKGLGALNAMPLYLVTTNPDVKAIKDFTSKDKIALPGVKTSIQAITLQMACEKAFGPGQASKLDTLTVSMGHPDAMVALLGGRSEIDSHFGSPPFQEQEIESGKAHKVLDSYDVLGGPHTFNLVWATSKFVEANPKVTAAFMQALEDSIAEIKKDPKAAATTWIKAEGIKLSVDDAVKLIEDPQNEWTTTPKKMMVYLDFMNRAGLVSAKTDTWKDMFFDTMKDKSGS